MWLGIRVFVASVVVDEGGEVLWLSAKKHGSSSRRNALSLNPTWLQVP